MLQSLEYKLLDLFRILNIDYLIDTPNILQYAVTLQGLINWVLDFCCWGFLYVCFLEKYTYFPTDSVGVFISF